MSGTLHGGFQFLLIFELWDISFHAVVVFGQHNQRKLLNFENWVNGEVSKSAKI